MKKILTILAASTMLTSTAIAGNVNPPVIVDVAPVAAAVGPDWSGFYAGGMAGFDSGTVAYSTPPGTPAYVEYDYEANTSYGGFAGYNFQNGSFVYGAEAAYNSGGFYAVGHPVEASKSVLDLKARAGFAAGNALIYGVVGYSTTEWTRAPETFSGSGMSYGAGVDYLLGEHFFVGAEYLVRGMSGVGSPDDSFEGHSNVNSAEIRAGWKF